MKLSNHASKQSIFYLLCAIVVSLAVGGYCQTKFTPVNDSTTEKTSTTLESK